METNILLLVVYAWLAYFISVMAHEIGHRPSKMQFKLFPIPLGRAVNSESRYGGLIVNGIIMIAVWYFHPEHIFFQLLGLASLINILLYAFIGPFIHQSPLAQTINDVGYGNWLAFVIGVGILYLFGMYYWEIILNIIKIVGGAS